MAAGKHNAAAVVHGLQAWRLLLLPSIIGEHMRALNGVRQSLLIFSANRVCNRFWTVRSAFAMRSALAITGTHWTDCRAGIGIGPQNWDESILFPSSQPPTPGPRPPLHGL